MHPVFLYFAMVWSLVALAVIVYHVKTAGSMTLSVLRPVEAPQQPSRRRKGR